MNRNNPVGFKRILAQSLLIACMGINTQFTHCVASEKLTVLTEQSFPMNYTENGRDDDEIIGFATELVIAVLNATDIVYDTKTGRQVLLDWRNSTFKLLDVWPKEK